MKTSLIHALAASGALLCLFIAPNAHGQNLALTAGLQPGGALAAGQSRSWAFSVPAGNYLAFARVSYALRSTQDSAGLQCQLKPMGADFFLDFEQASITGGQGVDGEMTLMSQATVPASGALAVECYASGGATGAQTIQDVRLELIQVGSFNTLTAIDTSGPAAPVRRLRGAAAQAPRRN